MATIQSAAQHIEQARADAAGYLQSHAGNEAERARMLHELGCLRSALAAMQNEYLATFSAPPAPKGFDTAPVMVDGVEIEAHYRYTYDGDIELSALHIGGQCVNALLGDERDDAITEAVLAFVRAQGIVAAVDRAAELAEDAA